MSQSSLDRFWTLLTWIKQLLKMNEDMKIRYPVYIKCTRDALRLAPKSHSWRFLLLLVGVDSLL